MEIYVLNKSYSPIAVIDSFKSLIWTTRYYSYGDFELYIPANESLLEFLQKDYFLMRDDDKSVMVIERVEIQTDAENGDFFIISGRSLESILLRRIVYQQFKLNETTVVNSVKALINYCTIIENPGSLGQYREIPGLTIDETFDKAESISAQFTGGTLFDAVIAILKPLELGFKMTLSNSQLILSIYEGTKGEVTFSPEFDNLINSNYVYDYANYSNQIYIAGEGEGSARKWAAYSPVPGAIQNPPRGLDRREIFIDARDISSNNGEINASDYSNLLIERAKEKLVDYNIVQTFEAEIEPNTTYQYKTDYNLGDVVNVTNEYGVTAKPRIVEIIENWDDTGYKVIPTFEEMEVE